MIKKRIPKRPPRIVIHGVASVGKTTLASKAPNPVFICCEDGAREVDAAVWTFDEKDRVVPRSVEEFRAALRALTQSHAGYETLVIDGLGEIDAMIQAQICKENKWKNIQQPGFGKGEAAVYAVWREIVAELEEANNSGLMLILLGHSRVENFNAPDAATFGRYQLAITSHKLGDAAGLLFTWSDVYGFARFEQMLTESNKRTISVGIQGARVLHLTRTDAYDGKCRYRNAPPQIPMSWPELARVISAETANPEELRRQLSELVPQLPEDKRTATSKWLADTTLTVDDLTIGLDKVKATLILTAQ